MRSCGLHYYYYSINAEPTLTSRNGCILSFPYTILQSPFAYLFIFFYHFGREKVLLSFSKVIAFLTRIPRQRPVPFINSPKSNFSFSHWHLSSITGQHYLPHRIRTRNWAEKKQINENLVECFHLIRREDEHDYNRFDGTHTHTVIDSVIVEQMKRKENEDLKRSE